MQALRTRTDEEGAQHHAHLPVRVYAEDGVQEHRIRHAREFVRRATELSAVPSPRIIELGCGTGDISGPFSPSAEVIGYDVNAPAVECARGRFPQASYEVADILTLTPVECDVLILCETLEHINDPDALLRAWLPKARTSVISHPIDGDLTGDMSGGDHCWSYSHDDFGRWAGVGGHQYLQTFGFQMGAYFVNFGLTRRV